MGPSRPQVLSPVNRIVSMFTFTSRKWMGVLRLTPVVLGLILLLSFTDFGLAVAYARQLYDAPLDQNKLEYSHAKHWATA